MIRYALVCDAAHEFEAWFAGSAAYEEQSDKRLIACPHCSSSVVRKQIMSPAVRDSGEKTGRPPRREGEFEQVAAEVRRRISETHAYVGDRFAEEARAMYYGDAEERAVWGEVTREEARDLLDEGVPALPLPPPFAPPRPPTKGEIN